MNQASNFLSGVFAGMGGTEKTEESLWPGTTCGARFLNRRDGDAPGPSAQGILFEQQIFGNGMKLHIGSPFVNLSNFGIAVQFFHRIFLGIPVSAVNFQGF